MTSENNNYKNSTASPDEVIIRPIAHIRSGFGTKFGIPRQSLLADVRAEIIFEKEFSIPETVRGLENYEYIWLLWRFSANADKPWHPTVRPPRLGGNERVGVFATRSPFRPNSMALSNVRLVSVAYKEISGLSENRIVLTVEGADLMDGTPIYDIKPYIPYVDAHPEARGGFTDTVDFQELEVKFEESAFVISVTEQLKTEIAAVLKQDPRPSYQEDPERIYGMEYAGYDVKFRVENGVAIVTAIERIQ